VEFAGYFQMHNSFHLLYPLSIELYLILNLLEAYQVSISIHLPLFCFHMNTKQEGWTKYSENGEFLFVPCPPDECFVFDVEVCLSSGHVPTLACAVSENAW